VHDRQQQRDDGLEGQRGQIDLQRIQRDRLLPTRVPGAGRRLTLLARTFAGQWCGTRHAWRSWVAVADESARTGRLDTGIERD